MNPKASRFLPFVVVLCLCLVLSLPTYAQVAGATLSGTITDAQGAAVVGAKVSAKNAATGVTTETTTNNLGAYSLVNILPANYDISATATGFRTAVSKITLTVGSQQTMNLALVVGEVSQTVEVTGAAPIIELTNATISGNVESQQIVELPLNGRDWASLATLQPGVVSVRVHEQVTQPGGNLRGLGNQMTIDGNRPTQNVYRLNGIVVNDYSNAGPGNVLGASVGVDAIQEFSVLTANYSAEYGFTSGGVINAITKSGTNTFHGSVYEFIRNKAFDSSDYLSGANKPPFVRNQFGGSGGWKILKDRLFLFGDYEGLRQSKGIPVTAKVLSLNARKGILSGGSPVGSCTLPNTTKLDPAASVCVDNFVKSYFDALDPLPQTDCSPANTCSNVYGGVQGVTDNYFTLRADYKISDKDSVNSSYYRDHSSWSKPNAFDNITTGYILPNQAASLEEAHIFSPAMVNSIRFGYAQSIVTNPGLTHSLAAQVDSALGITSTTFGPGLSGQGGGSNIQGLTSFGGFAPQGGFSDWVQNYQLFDDMTRTMGNHTMKFGVEFIRNHTDLLNGNGNGSVGFRSISDFLQNIPFTVREPTIPPFTAGNTKHYNRSSIFGVYVQDDWKMRPNLTWNVGLRYEMSTIPYEVNGKFVLLPKLWSNPGNCSEDINGLPIASLCSGLRTSVFDSNPTLKNFEPRIGFSWDPFRTGKTSIRGGFGMFDVLPLPFMFGLNALQASPSGAEVDLTNKTTCVTPSDCPIPQGSFVKGIAAAAAGATAAGNGRWQYTDPNPKRNYVMQWNANVQRQITPSTSIMVAYAGSRGIHNPFQTDTLNTCFPTNSSAGWLFPNPSVANNGCNNSGPFTGPTPTGIVPNTLVNPIVGQGLILSTAFLSQSWYKSLQVSFEKKMSHGLQFEVSYTWQNSTDTSSGSFAGDNYSSNPTAATPFWDLGIIKGLSDFNISRNLSINWMYQIPTPASFAGPAGWIARGWSAGGVMTVSDGVPMWPLTGLNSDPLGQNNGEPMDIPSLAPGCTTKNLVQPGNLQYLKPSCFIYPVAPNQSFWNANCNQTPNLDGLTIAQAGLNPLTCTNLLGNLPRNAIIGPGLVNFDMSFIKNNHIRKISENFNVQFRAELFNIFNRTNLPGPTDNLVAQDPLLSDNPSFGQIDQATQVPMREVQFALKIVW
ncbi:MAG: carboxypeptidase regulatory-like domain-containing protein [Acidobacteriia bacterium]|nr:carboxypeptidase regulatory-like domain-containing protein [Terriglobia bacterium]